MVLYPTLWRGSRPSVWEDLLSARRDVDRVFDRFFSGSSPSGMTLWSPSVDVRETQDEIEVLAELPGLRREDVRVTVEDGVLTISGEKRQELQEGKEGGDYHLIERCYGKFERSFALPRTVNPEQVKAKFQDGLLHVTLAKVAEAKPKQIEVK